MRAITTKPIANPVATRLWTERFALNAAPRDVLDDDVSAGGNDPVSSDESSASFGAVPGLSTDDAHVPIEDATFRLFPTALEMERFDSSGGLASESSDAGEARLSACPDAGGTLPPPLYRDSPGCGRSGGDDDDDDDDAPKLQKGVSQRGLVYVRSDVSLRMVLDARDLRTNVVGVSSGSKDVRPRLRISVVNGSVTLHAAHRRGGDIPALSCAGANAGTWAISSPGLRWRIASRSMCARRFTVRSAIDGYVGRACTIPANTSRMETRVFPSYGCCTGRHADCGVASRTAAECWGSARAPCIQLLVCGCGFGGAPRAEDHSRQLHARNRQSPDCMQQRAASPRVLVCRVSTQQPPPPCGAFDWSASR